VEAGNVRWIIKEKGLQKIMPLRKEWENILHNLGNEKQD
jgi:hypothetical protein